MASCASINRLRAHLLETSLYGNISGTHAQAHTKTVGTFFVQVHINIWFVRELNAGWLVVWLAGWLADWPAGGLPTCWRAGWARWLGWLTVWLADGLTGWPAVCLATPDDCKSGRWPDLPF